MKKLYAMNGRKKNEAEMNLNREWMENAHISRVTHEFWKHIPAGSEVTGDGVHHFTAPKESGFYTLWEYVSRNNFHQAWEWEKEI